MMNMGIRMVSDSEIQAGGLSDPCSDSGKKKRIKMSYRKMSPLTSVWSSPKSHHF